MITLIFGCCGGVGYYSLGIGVEQCRIFYPKNDKIIFCDKNQMVKKSINICILFCARNWRDFCYDIAKLIVIILGFLRCCLLNVKPLRKIF